ncbi:uncharacterized protein G2W53_004247 [Senna tora]|uniref:Uncharacterized protein n=1 Tax=Senna tora TaxID=362788 RepID=A0A835CH41_9FABA|nr:uncharacterized protein G2W53_004247 [Senna tora]
MVSFSEISSNMTTPINLIPSLQALVKRLIWVFEWVGDGFDVVMILEWFVFIGLGFIVERLRGRGVRVIVITILGFLVSIAPARVVVVARG